MEKESVYACIDLKSFYASVECVDRGMDPLSDNLVVADMERGEKTICLAITPPMKALGIRNRCRIYEIPKDVPYIAAVPRMQRYIDVSAEIYGIYLKYIAKEDIHVYSIDEVFIDLTSYLKLYQIKPKELCLRMIEDIKTTTGITASAGIGTNLYLAKVAMDILAKHSDDHIAYLDEQSFQDRLWDHIPLSDFWRIGRGISEHLERLKITTMRQLAHADEEMLYRHFGIDAELMIDHAWGKESATIADIKAFKAKNHSLGSGQILPHGYTWDQCRIVVREMAEALALELAEKELTASSVILHLSYENYADIKPSKGSAAFETATSSSRIISEYTLRLYDQIAHTGTLLRKINLSFGHVQKADYEQFNLFLNPAESEKEKQIQQAILKIKKKYGKNAVLKGTNFMDGATARQRNRQIGGHRA